MRSLSPCDSRYSPLAAGVTTFSSAPAPRSDGVAAPRTAVIPKTIRVAKDVFIGSSILISGRGSGGMDGRDRVGHGPAFQRLGAHRVRRVARVADRDLHGRLKIVAPEARHQAVDDAHRPLVVGGAEHERERP